MESVMEGAAIGLFITAGALAGVSAKTAQVFALLFIGLCILIQGWT